MNITRNVPPIKRRDACPVANIMRHYGLVDWRTLDHHGHCGKSAVIGPRNACGLSAVRRKEKRYNASAGLDMPDAASGAQHDADFFA